VEEPLVPETPVSSEICLSKAKECRKLAGEAKTQAARIMLSHIAETWERVGNLTPGASLDIKA
jgi:hypothetical protein